MPSMTIPPTASNADADIYSRFVRTLNAEGLRAALAEVLELTDYRFIGLWRFQDGKARSVVHVDRDNPEVLEAAEVPDTATYCSYVRASGAAFRTANALMDERLALHPARTVVQSYCGVPLQGMDGKVLGTLCHYDLVPRDPAQINLAAMSSISSHVTIGGHLPAYPG